MKSKATLTMIELLIMLPVFALAAALCLRAFATADRMSDDSAALDSAVTQCQNAAELLKGSGGDYDYAADILGGEWDGDVLTVKCEEYTLHVEPAAGENELMGEADIRALDEAGGEIFAISAAWQKEGAHE